MLRVYQATVFATVRDKPPVAKNTRQWNYTIR